jgi:DNA-sulfur modification-associated
MKKIGVKGFLDKPRHTSSGKNYQGRFIAYDVQWTGEDEDIFATFTITAEQVADAAESQMLWTDQDVQRGIKPGLGISAPRELSIGHGYPDPKIYIFDANKATEIAEKLLGGERLFLNPLVWNLRPGTFEAYWEPNEAKIYFYTGKIYLPDSHHRQQAILKAVRAYRDSASSYPKFSLSKQFKLELYFFSKEDEGNYFFAKNQLPLPTAKSRAYDLTTLDDLSLIAKKMIDKSAALKDNVNRVTDRLTGKNPQVVTMSTLREMVKTLSTADSLDEAEIEGLAEVAARFYDLLAEVRPELGKLDPTERRNVRETLIVDAAVMMHGYASVMRDIRDTFGDEGVRRAFKDWREKVDRLSKDRVYKFDSWRGDLFEKRNPLWRQVGVVKPGKDQKKLTVLNTGAARSECGRVLKQLLSMAGHVTDLKFLAAR